MIGLYLFIIFSILAICLYLPEILIIFYYGKRRKTIIKPKTNSDNLPFVSILLPVYNEEKLIERKIKNTLQIKMA